MHDVLNEELRVDTKSVKWIYYFLLRTLESKIDILSEDISTAEILSVVDDILRIDIENLKNTILTTLDAEYIYKYQKNILTLLKRLRKLLNKKVRDETGKLNILFDILEKLENEDLTDEIIKAKKLKYMCKYANDNKNADIKKISEEVLKSKNAKYIYLFSKYTNGYNSTLFANALLKIGNLKYIYLFAKDIKNIDTILFASKIIESDSLKYIYLFARDVDIDPRIFEDVVCESEDPKYIYMFARDIKNVNISRYQHAIMDTCDIDYICEFAKNIKCNIDIFVIHASILGDPEYIYRLAKIKKTGIKELVKAIKATEDPKFIYLFAKDIKGVNITSFETSIVKCGDPEYMYLFAKNIRGADIIYIGKMILRTNDIYWIYKFFSEIPNADIEYAIQNIKTYHLDQSSKYLPSLERLSKEKIKNEDPKEKEEKVQKDINKKVLGAIRSNNPKLILATALKYKKHLYWLGEAILKTNDAKYIYEYALNLKVYDRVNFTNRIIELGNPEYIYKFARDIDRVNKEKLAFALSKLGNAEYIYKFARDIKDSDKKLLASALIKTGDVKYVYLFEKDIHDIDILSMLNKSVLPTNFKGEDELLATPYDLFEILVSAAYNDFDLKKLSQDLNLPYIKVSSFVKYIRIKYMLVTHENSLKCPYCISPSGLYFSPAIMPICEENLPKLGRKYNDINILIEYFKNNDTADLYISNLVEKYYLEPNQEFLDKPKTKAKK